MAGAKRDNEILSEKFGAQLEVRFPVIWSDEQESFKDVDPLDVTWFSAGGKDAGPISRAAAAKQTTNEIVGALD
jgi:hypothetical protein